MTEQQLYETKWYEYRPMKPEVATKVFMLEWARRMREYNEYLGYSRHVNFLKSFERFDTEYLVNHKLFKMLNKLRQWADSHGMSYDKFWLWATDTHLNLKFHKNFINVYFNKKLLARVKELKAEHEKDFILFSNAKHMRPDAYMGYEFQMDYYAYIVGKVEKRHPKEKVPHVLNSMVKNNKMSQVYLMMETKYAGVWC